ncbi:TRAP transporter substrate-binding protein [Conservatibacter flavescens]|uniref:TRAP transporter substrate-binding protein DctP n=1 Tax=Conservatibacter flavescens TaxID=28161 RepID=A0A2M8S1T2_9PAST|nr:TRAP transporter substrate-binding protein [Conservatibacter flavescens]PJG85087.1 TRAP transporter substrate-binding protein DctP [Conservatibacter flavescens]
MKKYHLFAPLLALTLSTTAFSADKVTLKIGHFLPALSTIQQDVLEPWCQHLNTQSKGRIECQLYPSNQLGGTAAQLIDQVRNGVADIVWTAPGYSSGRFKIIEGLEMPFLLPDAKTGNKVAWEYFEKYAKDTEFKQFKVLSMQTDGGVTFHANKPLNHVEDLQGLKLRTPTRLASQVIQALGGSAISIAPSQVAESVSKGVVDGAMGAWEVVLPTKLDEVTKYHVMPAKGEPFPTVTVLSLIMNKKKYDSLPADLKTILDNNSGPVLLERITQAWESAEENARKKSLEQGGTITEFNAEHTEKMKQLTANVPQDWFKNMEKQGLDGQKMLDDLRQMVQKYQQ